MINFKIDKQFTTKRTRWVTVWNGQWQNNLPLGDLNQVLWCTNLTLAPTGSHMNKEALSSKKVDTQ
jgi:hypothetical protein